MRKLLIVALLVILAGCTTGLSTEEATDNSRAVESAELFVDSEDALYLNVTFMDPVEKNNERCTTSYNPAIKAPQTTCYDNWHTVEMSGATVTANTSYEQRVDVGAGERLSVRIPWESATYRVLIHSPNSPDTWFQVKVDVTNNEASVESAGYHDSY